MTDTSAQTLEANLALLPPAAERALRAATGQPSVSLQATDAGVRASIRTEDGRWVPIHASVDPHAASDRVADRFAEQQPPLLIVVGLGLGYLLDALERRGSATRVLAIEPLPGVTRAMLARRDWTAWLASGRLTILAGPDYTGSSEVWGLFGRGAATPPIIMSPLLQREFGEAASRAAGLVRQIVAGAKANEEARRQFAGRYLLNTLTNLPVLATEGDVTSLFGAFPRVPAVVVGAGPSLDRNVRDLAKLEGKVLIIAVDTAVRPLLAAGIRPHLVVAVDPSEANARHLRDLPDCRGLWFAAEASTDARVFAQFPGRTFTFKVSDHHPWPWLAAQGAGRGRLRAWGSVLTTAFDLACQAGCDPIVFAGADLAYTNGLQYCRNTVYEEQWRDFPTDGARAEFFKTYLADRPHMALPDVRGGETLTTPHFVQFRDWIVARAAEAADRRVVNATGGGILHGGRIAQTDFSVLHLPRARHDLGLQRRLAAAWTSGGEQRRLALGTLQTALADRALPFEAWLDFGGDTASAAEIADSVSSAALAIASEVRTTAYLEERSAFYDTQAQSLERAQSSIHPHYQHARVQAEAQQAYVLLDVMQRSSAVTPGDGVLDIVRAAGQLPAGLRVLDIGCGIGRTMEPLAAAGFQVDGVDISQGMINLARQHPLLAAAEFFLTDGDTCGAAPDGSYDLACAHLSLHLIKSRLVRQRLLHAIARALRPGGTFFAQMPFHAECDAAAVPAPHVSWPADVVDGPLPRSRGHVWPTPDALPQIFQDFSEHFRDVRFQWIDLPAGGPRFDGRSSSVTHLLVSGSPAGSLAVRVYAPFQHREALRPEAMTAAAATTST